MTENHISLQSWHLSLFFVGPGLLCCMAIEKKWFSFFLTWNIWKIRNQQRTTNSHPSKFKCISTEELSFLLPDFGQHPVFNFFGRYPGFLGQNPVFNFFSTTSNIQVFLDNIQFSIFFRQPPVLRFFGCSPVFRFLGQHPVFSLFEQHPVFVFF